MGAEAPKVSSRQPPVAFTIRLTVTRRTTPEAAERSIRQLLKYALRVLQLRCTAIERSKP
jgi:hypothetical protein